MRKIFFFIGLVIIFFGFGFLVWEVFTGASFYQLHIENILFVFQRMTNRLLLNLIFAFSIGIIPILYLLVYKFAKLNSIKQRMITLGIIILSGLIFWQYRIFQLKYQFDFKSVFTTDNYATAYSTEGLKFEIYLLIGLVIGSVISLITYRSINRKKNYD